MKVFLLIVLVFWIKPGSAQAADSIQLVKLDGISKLGNYVSIRTGEKYLVLDSSSSKILLEL